MRSIRHIIYIHTGTRHRIISTLRAHIENIYFFFSFFIYLLAWKFLPQAILYMKDLPFGI